MTEEDIGYLKRAVEDLAKLVEKHMDKEERERREDKEQFCTLVEGLNQRLAKIEADVSLAKTVIKFGKALGLILMAIATFKFGDISGLWQEYFPKH